MMLPDQLFTLDMLKDLASLVLAVVIVVSFLKLLFKVKGRAAKLSAFGTALILLAVVYANQGKFAFTADPLQLVTTVVLWLLNAILITLIAMKAYEEFIEPFRKKDMSDIFK